MSWWIDLAGRLSMPKLDQLGLLDIEHQAGGHSVIPWFCVAAPAALHSSYVAFVGDLCSHYYHAHGGWMDGLATPVEEDEQYRERLKAVGLTASCHSERNRLMESVYPMDGTDKNLNLLLAQPSEALAALEPLLLDATARNRLKIFIIAENSD